MGSNGNGSQKDVIISATGVKRLYMMGRGEGVGAGGGGPGCLSRRVPEHHGALGFGQEHAVQHCPVGWDTPTEGQVLIDGTDISTIDQLQVAYLRCRTIGYIFQTFNLIEVMTALENVTLPMIFAGMDEDEAAEKGRGLLDKVGLGERYDHRPEELSGGQQQRVAIARSLANDPSIILADEPTGNLDLKTGEEIINMLENLKNELGVTVISATHDHKMLAASDRVVYLTDGEIVDIKKREELSIEFGTIGGSVT